MWGYSILKKYANIVLLTINRKIKMEEQIIENKQDNNKNSQKQIAGAIIIAGLIIAGAILLKGNNAIPSANKPVATANTSNIDLKTISTDEHILGNPNAKVVIVEYSDTECPFCKVFHNTMHQIIEKNNGDVAWVYRHYPIPQLHPKAFHEAEAIECAWDKGGNEVFWKYIDEVYARTQSNNKLDVVELPKIAKDVGINVSSFNTCLASGKYKEKIQKYMDDGSKAGANGTPYSVIVAKNDITTKKQAEIMIIAPNPRPDYFLVSFDAKKKNVMSMNGALPQEMINKIITVLLK